MAPIGPAIRENAISRKAAPTVQCPRCGGINPATTTRCRSCFTPLPSKAPPGAPQPPATPPSAPPEQAADAMLGPLEAMTMKVDAPEVLFQCPECGRIVEESASHCACGAIFA